MLRGSVADVDRQTIGAHQVKATQNNENAISKLPQRSPMSDNDIARMDEESENVKRAM